MASDLHTNRCAIQRFWHCWKQCKRAPSKGAPTPNLSANLILKYLNPIPATGKGHMKWPRHGVKSTRPKTTASVTQPLQLVPPPVWMQLSNDFVPPAVPTPNVIGNNCNESIANMSCLLTDSQELFTTTWRVTSLSCLSTGACVSWSFTIMKQMPSWPRLLPGWMIEASSTHKKQISTSLCKKSSSQNSTLWIIKQQNTLNNFLRRKNASFNLLSHTITR